MPIKEEKPVSKKKQKYLDFIASKEWKIIRSRILNARGRKCEQCGAKDNLQIHHLTYERVGGKEEDSDLKILCKRCHMDIHGLRLDGKTKQKISKNKKKLSLYKRIAFDKYNFKSLKEGEVWFINQNGRGIMWLARMTAFFETGKDMKFSSKKKAMDYVKSKLRKELKLEKK